MDVWAVAVLIDNEQFDHTSLSSRSCSLDGMIYYDSATVTHRLWCLYWGYLFISIHLHIQIVKMEWKKQLG